MMQRVGLIGWPVAHSLSPVMHNAAFAALGMDWEYVLVPVEPGRLGEVLEELRARGLAGANVTVPHKRDVIEHLDRLSEEAAAIGAVNTISAAGDGALTGSNTDGMGFLADLRSHGFDPGGVDALVIGTGGSARAVVHALSSAGASSVVVLGRSLERARELTGDMAGRFPSIVLEEALFPGGLDDRLHAAHLVVNCTPLGMVGHEPSTGLYADAPFGERHLVCFRSKSGQA
ncbi:MAG: shikimate dehydrogenase [Deltaproteobacteria bacterium]|nr:shikimate dehydrogenase [Deltaproteobacteria bacterium]